MDMYARTQLVIGDEGLEHIKSSRVLVVGLGGVGGYIVEALARCGIGTLGLCDYDKVDVTNKNRQILALDSTVGRYKTEVAAERVHDINPDCLIRSFCADVSSITDEISAGEWDYIADAIDDVPAKISLIKRSLSLHIPMISCMGTGNKLDPTAFRITDISKTNTCPLAKKVRLELRREGIEKGIKVLFSTEAPVAVPSGSPVGSLSFVPSAAGLMIAGEIVRDLIK